MKFSSADAVIDDKHPDLHNRSGCCIIRMFLTGHDNLILEAVSSSSPRAKVSRQELSRIAYESQFVTEKAKTHFTAFYQSFPIL